MLNLVLGIIWLVLGLGLLAYEFFNGSTRFRMQWLDVSWGWLFLVLALYNFVRWYSSRGWKAEQQALRLAHEERLRQVRYHERPEVPDPTFDFSDKPAPPPPQNPGEPGKSAP